LYIPPPDAPARKQIFASNLAKFQKNISLDKLTSVTEGFSGADLSSICQEAKMGAVRNKLKGKEDGITTESVMQIIAGRRPSITKKDLREYESFTMEYGERR
jgi:SpoVK/Ycf46/Vps4 family AAA+-type ATPase